MTNPLASNIIDAPEGGAADPVFERHPAPSLLFTRDGVIAQVNAAARQMLRSVEVPPVGAPLSEFFPVNATSLTGMPPPLCVQRTEVRRADGTLFSARVHVVAAGPGPGAPLLASIEDLSEFQAQIDGANREFEALTSAAGHDLRGPLRILKGFTEALADECGEALNEDGTVRRLAPIGGSAPYLAGASREPPAAAAGEPKPEAKSEPEPAPREPTGTSLTAVPAQSEDRLVSEVTSLAAAAAFARLASAPRSHRETPMVGDKPLDEIVQELLRPLLQTWLDENLPQIVERLVQAEIDRIGRSGTG